MAPPGEDGAVMGGVLDYGLEQLRSKRGVDLESD